MLYQNVQIVEVIIKQLHLDAQQGKKLKQSHGKTGCKEHQNRGNEMIDIKGALGLAKRAINRKVIVITNCYQTTVGKVSYLITTDTEISSQSAGAWQTA